MAVKKIILSVFLSLLLTQAALAQATNFGFAPVGVTQNISVSVVSSNILLNNSSGDTVLIQNTGANTAYVKCAATATTSDFPIQAGWGIVINCPPNNRVSAITASSTSTLIVTKGLGNFVMTGGGSGGGGGGGSVTQGTDPWLVAGKGTAGTPSGGVVTVQGVASMTPFLTTTTLNPETTKVIGTVNQGTSPWVVSGPLTDAQLRATPVPISGTVTATPTGTQAVSVASGQVASGAVASGAYASGSIASGAMVDMGVQGDAVCSTATGNCSLIALTKYQNSAINSPPPLNLNGTPTAWTGLTPGVAQTGTIVAANVDATSKGGVAYGAMANYGTSPGAVKVDGVNAFVTNNVAVIGPTADGSAASTAPVLTAGTSDGTATGLVAIPKVSAGGVSSNFLVDAAGTNVATVKATSTPAAASDTAVVVDQRPGTTLATKSGFGVAALSSVAINATSSGNNTVITRSVGTIKVYGLLLSCATSVTVDLKDGTGTSLTNPMTITTIYLPVQAEPHFTTTSTNNFVASLGGANTCNGRAYYLDN